MMFGKRNGVWLARKTRGGVRWRKRHVVLAAGRVRVRVRKPWRR